MPFGFLRGIAADVKLSDEEYVKNEKERFVPWSLTPFREPLAKTHGGSSEGEEEGETAPEWLELTTYDIKYYTNDWWHRVLFASQLGVYAILAAFSGSFNVGWEISSDTMDIFTGNATALTAEAITTNEKNSMVKSFTGVNIMLFISRMLLFAQYLRGRSLRSLGIGCILIENPVILPSLVLSYRRKSKQMWSWRFYLAPIATFIAGFIFLGCYIVMKERPNSKSAAITQLTLWGLAIGVQVLAAAVTPEDPDKVLKNQGAVSPRLSTLTVIILGEGLNGICSTLRHSINSLGLTPKMVAQALSVLLVLYFVWLLYFDGFRIRFSASRALDEIWLWLHFPLHLSLIMLLEGIKNLFLYLNVVNANDLIFSAIGEVSGNNGSRPDHPQIEKLLLPLKISWSQELLDLDAAEANNPDDPDTASSAQLYRWFAGIIHSVFLLFNDEPDPEAESDFNQYIATNDTAIVNDIEGNGDGSLLEKANSRYEELMVYSAHWLVAVAGTLLICMAILNTMQRRPKNRFAWGYSLNRTAIGCILILVGGSTSNMSDNWIPWIIPTVAIGYLTATVADWIILYFSIGSIRRKEVLSSDQSLYRGEEKGPYDTGRGVDLRQLSDLPYDHTGRRDIVGSSSAAEFNPYGEVDQSRKQGSRGSSSDPTRQSLLGKDGEGGY
ncbi:hypothetical protein FRC04_005689 [Tulasnella sp. 424]|nr:hypothetical protein FRC04_005689 [Tulasnella sp. 424]